MVDARPPLGRHEILVHALRYKWHERRQNLDQLDQHPVKRLISGFFVRIGLVTGPSLRPKPTSAPALIPIGKVIQENIDGPCSDMGLKILQGVRYLRDHFTESCLNPLI